MPADTPDSVQVDSVVFRVQRFDPERDDAPYFQDIEVPVKDGGTILDYLIHIKWCVDGTLTMRYSCQSAICGSCAVKVNGHAKLACKTQAEMVWATEIIDGVEKRVVTVQPQGNQKVVKDLVVDLEDFFAKYIAVRPTLAPKEAPPEDGTEYRVRPADFEVQRLVAVCIQCGACYSECNTLQADPAYLGPAALAKAFRFVTDPRDGDTEKRLLALIDQGGIWDCTRCCECTQVCPKDVAPMERIVELRGMALAAAEAAEARGDHATARLLAGSDGARHVIHFTESVARSGVLDETRLPVEVMGLAPGKVVSDLVGLRWGDLASSVAKGLHQAPTALRMLGKGKLAMPYFMHHDVEDVEEVRRMRQALDEVKARAAERQAVAEAKTLEEFLEAKQQRESSRKSS